MRPFYKLVSRYPILGRYVHMSGFSVASIFAVNVLSANSLRIPPSLLNIKVTFELRFHVKLCYVRVSFTMSVFLTCVAFADQFAFL